MLGQSLPGGSVPSILHDASARPISPAVRWLHWPGLRRITLRPKVTGYRRTTCSAISTIKIQRKSSAVVSRLGSDTGSRCFSADSGGLKVQFTNMRDRSRLSVEAGPLFAAWTANGLSPRNRSALVLLLRVARLILQLRDAAHGGKMMRHWSRTQARSAATFGFATKTRKEPWIRKQPCIVAFRQLAIKSAEPVECASGVPRSHLADDRQKAAFARARKTG